MVRHWLFFYLLVALLPLSCWPGRAAHAAPPSVARANAVVALAHASLGLRYARIGDSPRTGFSCIGFVHYLYGRIGVDVPYDLQRAYASAPHIRPRDLRPGDLVFFVNTVWRGLSHVALYVGDDRIIGADNTRVGVEITHLTAPYWMRHYLGATRPLAVTRRAPMPRTGSSPIHQHQAPHAPSVLHCARTTTLRSGPGVGYATVDTLSPRQIIRLVRSQSGWLSVRLRVPWGSEYGWIPRSATTPR